jgi:hypothetical protein
MTRLAAFLIESLKIFACRQSILRPLVSASLLWAPGTLGD